jgi:hypothetical protein
VCGPASPQQDRELQPEWAGPCRHRRTKSRAIRVHPHGPATASGSRMARALSGPQYRPDGRCEAPGGGAAACASPLLATGVTMAATTPQPALGADAASHESTLRTVQDTLAPPRLGSHHPMPVHRSRSHGAGPRLSCCWICRGAACFSRLRQAVPWGSGPEIVRFCRLECGSHRGCDRRETRPSCGRQ